MFMLMFTAGAATLSAYFFLRFWLAFRALGWWHLAVLGGLALLGGSRFIARALRDAGHQELAAGLQALSVAWLVLLFWFVCADLLPAAWNLVAMLAVKLRPMRRRLVIPPRPRFLSVAVVVAAAGVWAEFEAADIRVRRVVVEVAQLPPSLASLRIAQLSDLHLGSVGSAARLARAVQVLEEIRPDLVVSTGDLVESELAQVAAFAEPLARIRPPLGKYAVLGNHEFYADVDDSVAFHRAAGFRLLRQAAVAPMVGLRLVGVDDPTVRWRDPSAAPPDECALLRGGPRQDLVLLLKHRPEVAGAALGQFDLQLSGHTHGGQVFPFGLIVRLLYPFFPGLHELPAGSKLFLTRGTGTWGAPLRLASPPEIVLIEFGGAR
jgi:uncharacterized protein